MRLSPEAGRPLSALLPGRFPVFERQAVSIMPGDTPNGHSWGSQALRVQVGHPGPLQGQRSSPRPPRGCEASCQPGCLPCALEGGQLQGSQSVLSSWPKVTQSSANNGQWVQPWPELEQRPGYFLELRPHPSWFAKARAEEGFVGRQRCLSRLFRRAAATGAHRGADRVKGSGGERGRDARPLGTPPILLPGGVTTMQGFSLLLLSTPPARKWALSSEPGPHRCSSRSHRCPRAHRRQLGCLT